MQFQVTIWAVVLPSISINKQTTQQIIVKPGTEDLYESVCREFNFVPYQSTKMPDLNGMELQHKEISKALHIIKK
jgi:hypothetical protein